MLSSRHDGVNEAERRRWNDEQWTETWPRREELTNAATAPLLDALLPQDGERILDVGSGAGATTLEVARRTAPSGLVVGADVSVQLTAFASRRAADEHVANVRFLVADVQVDRVEGGLFDAAMSQFGVMFFDEPTVAFANLASHVRPGGRLAFSCWQHMADNPWFTGAVLARFVAPAPEPAPGKSRTGPFSLADPERVSALLESAGWSQVERTPYELTVTVPGRAIVDDHELDGLGLSGADLDEAGDALRRHVARFDQGNGSFTVPLAFQVFTARV